MKMIKLILISLSVKGRDISDFIKQLKRQKDSCFELWIKRNLELFRHYIMQRKIFLERN